MREILLRGFHPCDGPETIVVAIVGPDKFQSWEVRYGEKSV